MLKTHYRQPIDWTVKGLQESEKSLTYWADITADVDQHGLPEEVLCALEDDLNTPQAIAEVHSLASRGETASLAGALGLLGIPASKFRDWQQARAQAITTQLNGVDTLIAARAEARKAKNYAEADRIRDELDAMGVTLKDSKDPDTGELVTTWEVKR